MTDPADKPEEAAPAAPAAPAKPAKKPLPMWVAMAGIVFFLGFLVVLAYLIWFLTSAFQFGKQDRGAYGDGRVVERQLFSDVQGWSSELLVDKKPDVPARIRFLLRDKDRKPITDATVDILMVNFDTPPKNTTHAALKMKEPGVYRGEVAIPAGGLWEARIQVMQKGNAYQITQRVEVPESDKEKADREAKEKAAKK